MTSSRATSADSNPCAQVGLERGWARDLCREPGSAVDDFAHVVGDVVDGLLRLGVDRDDRERRPAVAGDQALRRAGAERYDRRQHALDLRDLLRLGGDRLLVGVGQPAGAVVDRHGGGRLAAREAILDDLVGHDRGRVAGQEARDAVLGGVRELARQLAEHQQHQPDADDEPLRPAPAGPPRDRLQHRFTPPLPRACAALR